MASTKSLSNLKRPQLKAAAFFMGLPTTGTRAELLEIIQHRLKEPLHASARHRIVSVDMGIKNLGICVLDAPHLAHSGNVALGKSEANTSAIKVIAWKKMDVSKRLIRSLTSDSESDDAETPREQKTEMGSAVSSKAFRSSILANVALKITKDLYEYDPTHILIESQRFRSGGGAAVQEWTLRVNALESMLWACLETLRYTGKKPSPEVHEMSPKRVATFCCTRPYDAGLTVPEILFSSTWEGEAKANTETKKAVDKKDKIAIARSWISNQDSQQQKDVRLELSSQAQQVADAFLEGRKSRNKKNAKTTSDDVVGKLDDLADCLLQGVAWLKWEETRRKIGGMLQDHHE